MHSGYRKQYTVRRHKDMYLVTIHVLYGTKGLSMWNEIIEQSSLYSIYCHKKFKRGDIWFPNSTISIAITCPGTNVEAIVIMTVLMIITIKVQLNTNIVTFEKENFFFSYTCERDNVCLKSREKLWNLVDAYPYLWLVSCDPLVLSEFAILFIV